jgi:hypothetical protein
MTAPTRMSSAGFILQFNSSRRTPTAIVAVSNPQWLPSPGDAMSLLESCCDFPQNVQFSCWAGGMGFMGVSARLHPTLVNPCLTPRSSPD